MKKYFKIFIIVILLMLNIINIHGKEYYNGHYEYYNEMDFNILDFNNDKDFFNFYFNNERNYYTPNEWGVEVLWCKRLDDEMFLYVNKNMLAFIKSHKEKQFIKNLKDVVSSIENIDTISIFVEDEGYYIKRGIYEGEKLYEKRKQR